MSNFDISKSYLKECSELALDLRKPLEEVHTLLYGHLEHVVYALALVFYLKGISVVSLSATDVTLDVNVGQEVHLYTFYAIALARLTSSASDVERKSACTVPLSLGVLGLGKEITYFGEKSGVGCGVGSGCSSNRALVYSYDLVKVLHTADEVDSAGIGHRAIEVTLQGTQKDRVDER